MKNDLVPDVSQYLVSNDLAYFDYMEPFSENLCDNAMKNPPKIFIVPKSKDDRNETDDNKFDESFNDNSTVEATSVEDVQDPESRDDVRSTSCTGTDDYEEVFCNSLQRSQPYTSSTAIDSNDEKSSLLSSKRSKTASLDLCSSRESVVSAGVKCDRVLSFSKTSFKLSEVIEGSLCEVTAPTRMILLIEKISGVDLTVPKEEMHNDIMQAQCSKLPRLDSVSTGE